MNERSVNEWTFCDVHLKAVHGGSCDECGGDRNLVQVVRRYYLDVALSQVEKLKRDWATLRDHVTIIADAVARNEERQKVFVELRELIKRLEDR